LTVAEERITNN